MRWEYIDDDVNKSIDVAQNPTGVQTLAEVTDGNPQLSPIFRDYMCDHDLAQEMLVALRGADGRVWATVRLNDHRRWLPSTSQTGASCGRLLRAWQKASGAGYSLMPPPTRQPPSHRGWWSSTVSAFRSP
jgi:hypothetical protein